MKKLVTVGSFGAKIAIVITATVGGTALVGSSVFASLTATATNATQQSISTGTLRFTQAASGVPGLTAGFTSAVSLAAPGDTYNRFIDVTNGGTLAGQTVTLKVADANTTALTTDPTNGLQVIVRECPGVYTVTTGACSSGTETTVLGSTPANTLLGAQAATFSSLAPTASVHLKFIISLPAGSENTANGTLPAVSAALPFGSLQGLTSLLTWTFTVTPRTPVVSVA